MQTNFTFNQQQTDSQNYYFFQNGFSKEELNKISIGVENIEFVNAKTVGSESKEIRSSRIKWIPQNQDWYWLYEKLSNMATEANNALWNFDLLSMPELIQYTEYLDVEGGHYGWHQDIGPGILSLRKVSITVQLSDDNEYEGGELQFNVGGDGNLDAPKGLGTVVIFPSYLLHRVKKVTKGTRKSFVLWVGGAHYR
jgi:PKHD-type hydroxylase